MEIDSVDFETVSPLTTPFLPQAPVCLASTNFESSIAQSSQEPVIAPSLPVLPKPKNAIHELIRFNLDMEETTNDMVESTGEDLRDTLLAGKKISQEKQAMLEKVATATKSLNTWSTLSYVAGYVLNVGSVMTGSPFLMASGVIGIANRTLHDLNLMPSAAALFSKSEEMQEKIIKVIDSLSVALQTGFALSGAILAWQAGTLSTLTRSAFVEKTASAITTAGGIASMASQVGMSVHQKTIANLRADIKILDGDMAMQSQDDIPRKTKKMTDATEYVNSEAKWATNAVDLYT